ncbi:MAG: histidine ammonia-lyase [Acidobacteria bacterium 13_2_20CM_2_57_6]|nr:MAG: histidine ammonia-lyase [Acidobacteria bacterium 13_2_20CM_2_57_6]PYT38704.1 MAG: histidine ammonia-lyase [Acidobacteriota bacterium]PYT42347.1 MAG: histidine ammonia-lyase [Acidobacteriota bacterium]PYT57268.1 MAG: histidine ammonia-lyase [Acidobacteriota bacterium]
MSVALSGNDLTFPQLYDVALGGEQVQLTASAIERMSASRAVVDRLVASGETAYGINTGFGKLASVRISAEQVRQLQVNLVRSHGCGVGAPLSEPETRAMMLLRANALAKGLSGVRPLVVETLCKMLNAKVHPVIPSQGSVGASGDLAPLAHLAQVVIGEGRAMFHGETLPGGEAMKRAGITPIALEAKEGLSLLNGTQGMLALLSLALREADNLVNTADVAASLSLDALRGSPGAFDARIMHARAYAGAATTARNLAHLNEGSQIRESHRASEKDPRVQDAYSLRCTPQVHGAVRDSLAQAREMAAVELNSATDNPLVFVRDAKTGDIISGGNFHGQPLAMAADQVAIAIATLSGIVERRIEQMTNPLTSMLPAFLTPEPGLNSGFMIAQVTAAALTSENKALATPHSVDSISTSGNQEDYVSMGMSGARRLGRMLENLRHTIAIELLCACQGIDLLAPLQTGTLARRAYASVRAKSHMLSEDRPLAPDIEAVGELVADGAFSSLLG